MCMKSVDIEEHIEADNKLCLWISMALIFRIQRIGLVSTQTRLDAWEPPSDTENIKFAQFKHSHCNRTFEHTLEMYRSSNVQCMKDFH